MPQGSIGCSISADVKYLFGVSDDTKDSSDEPGWWPGVVADGVG